MHDEADNFFLLSTMVNHRIFVMKLFSTKEPLMTKPCNWRPILIWIIQQ